MVNREIKFRGIVLDRNEFIYGSLERRENVDTIGGYVITPPTPQDPGGDTIWYEEAVKGSTVGQFAGIKDKNTKYIYEGDIIQHNQNKFICGYSIPFGQFIYVAINKNLGNYPNDFILMNNHNNRKHTDMYHIQKYIEIIGNIHQNSELLNDQ